MFSGLLQSDLFKGRCSLEKRFFKQNYCHACHTGFAVVFPLPSCCVSSLFVEDRALSSKQTSLLIQVHCKFFFFLRLSLPFKLRYLYTAEQRLRLKQPSIMKTIQFPLRFVKYLDSLHYTRTQDNIQNRNIAWRQACFQPVYRRPPQTFGREGASVHRLACFQIVLIKLRIVTLNLS